MPINAHQIKSYLSYWLDAVDEHALHSPFFFDFYTGVVKGYPVPLTVAESLRKKLLADTRSVSFTDIGAKRGNNIHTTLGAIAKTSLTPVRYATLYKRILEKFQCKTIIELGTSLGINTLYLSSAPGATVFTFEGIDAIAETAALTFEFAEVSNVKLIKGNIHTTLPAFLQSHRKVDFVLMDANHTYEATMLYFKMLLPKLHEKSVVVIDDIYYSKEMTEAWKALKHHDLVYASADLFKCGILFFDPSLNKQHVILQF
ncbi:O-methyltransferase [Chryseosolibacter indicus]|uniref:Class I SAM-dependent methyltransferase n=1 Tax=Chryseosolibacter indicus TaxID=2782351 RepID=A0ABS5VTR2_9BACT|nr:class I SAM-dependent methyltransferase [Chryseosolibacter indicus]MBT1704818.1 class I SAM-dependent methyltransferase [Chryseosolibacter indicus]